MANLKIEADALCSVASDAADMLEQLVKNQPDYAFQLDTATNLRRIVKRIQRILADESEIEESDGTAQFHRKIEAARSDGIFGKKDD